MTRCAGAPDSSTRRASSIASRNSPLSRTARDHPTAERNSSTSAVPSSPASWNAPRSPISRGTSLVMKRTGLSSRRAATAAVSMLVAPGPPMEMHTPGDPAARARPSAMNAAPSSCAAVNARISDRSASSCTKGRIWAPGTRNAFVTPASASRSHRTCAPVGPRSVAARSRIGARLDGPDSLKSLGCHRSHRGSRP